MYGNSKYVDNFNFGDSCGNS